MSLTQTATNNRSILHLLFLQLRPKQWTKNLLVFAALLFSINHVDLEMSWRSFAGFFLFCFVSGSVYILNDYVDRHTDAANPDKQHRPMASGQLSPRLAILFGLVLTASSLIAAVWLELSFALLLVIYMAVNVSYSLHLKHVVIIDIMCVASGYVIRAIAGGLLIEVPFTPWFLLCTLLLSLFIACCKRSHELRHSTMQNIPLRKVLESYSAKLLDQFTTISATASIICYSLFTFTSERSIHLMWTIPLVIYGIFRYLFLVQVEEKGGTPEKVLLEDVPMIITVTLFAAATVLILIAA